MTATASDDIRIESRRGRNLTVAFYVVLGALLLAIVTGTVAATLPTGAAGRIARNSEAVFYVLAISAWIQFGLPRARVRRWLPILVAAAFVALGVALIASSLPSRLRTLNEPAIAIGVMVAYTVVRRPLPRWAVFAAVLTPVLLIAVGMVIAEPAPGERMEDSNILLQQAEMLVLVLLSVLALDVIDRGILDRHARTSRAARWTFYAALVAIPLVVIALGEDARVGAEVGHMLANLLGRTHEGFLGTLILCLYFAVGLRRTGEGQQPLG